VLEHAIAKVLQAADDHGRSRHRISLPLDDVPAVRKQAWRQEAKPQPQVEHLHPLEPESVVAELLPLGSVRRFT